MFNSYSERLRAGQMTGLQAAHSRSMIHKDELTSGCCAHRFEITDEDCLYCNGRKEHCDDYEPEE